MHTTYDYFDSLTYSDWESKWWPECKLLESLVDFYRKYDSDGRVHNVWDKYKDVEYVKELLRAKIDGKARADEFDLQVTPEFDEFISQFKKE